MEVAETAAELGASELSVSTAAMDNAGTAAELSSLRGGCHTVQCSAVVDFTSLSYSVKCCHIAI